jgi:hypothetical protein
MHPPGFRSAISFLNARGRSRGWTCHPDGAQQDHIEGQAQAKHLIEARETVREPAYRWRWMKALCLRQHPCGRFDSDNLKAARD